MRFVFNSFLSKSHNQNTLGFNQLALARILFLTVIVFVIHSVFIPVWTYSGRPILNSFAVGLMGGCLVGACAWAVFLSAPIWTRLLGLAILATGGLIAIAAFVSPELWREFRALPMTIVAVQLPMWTLRFCGWHLRAQTTTQKRMSRFSIADVLALTGFSAFVVWATMLMPPEIESIPMFFVTISVASALVTLPAILATLGDANEKKGLRRCAILFLVFGAATSAIAVFTWSPTIVALAGLSFFFGIYLTMNGVLLILRPPGHQLVRRSRSRGSWGATQL